MRVRYVGGVGFILALGLGGCDKGSAGQGAESAEPSSKIGIGAAAANALGLDDSKTQTEAPARRGNDDKTQPTIKFIDVMRFDAGSDFIDPCFFVVKGIYQASTKNDHYLVELTLKYTSGGKEVTKTSTIRLKDAVEHHHDAIPDTKQFIGLETKLSVADARPDRTTSFTGTAKLIKAEGDSRVVEAENTNTVTPK